MSVHTQAQNSESVETLSWLYSLEPAAIKLGLERTEALLAAVGDPHHAFPSVHITGTTGKGSTAAMTESILRTAGYKTGLYTSPHIFELSERFRLNGQPMPEDDMTTLVSELRLAMEGRSIDATFHEFTTVLAFLYFARCEVDIAVIEVCMGGLLDTTNVITPLVSVITNIGVDHTKWLGATKHDIAREKAGIVKQGTPLVTAENDPGVCTYLQSVARERDAAWHNINNDGPTQVLAVSPRQQKFTVPEAVSGRSRTFTINLGGAHQIVNARTALATTAMLRDAGWNISDADEEAGLASTIWRGRLDVVSEHPFVLIDGANNAASILALRAFIDEHMPRRDVLVYAKKEDKDLTPALDLIIPLFTHVIVTEGLFQPEPAQQLAKRIGQKHSAVSVIPNAQRATETGLAMIGSEGGLLVTGSLYMIPEALEYLRKKKLPAGSQVGNR